MSTRGTSTRTAAALCVQCGRRERDCPCQGAPERVAVVPDGDALAIRAYLRAHPGLRKDAYDDERTAQDPLMGLCYPAAEAWYHCRDCEPEVYCLSWSDVDPNVEGTHWYLRDPDTERWVDLALPLPDPGDDEGIALPPFEAGTHRGFITGDDPSKRARQVLTGIDAYAALPEVVSDYTQGSRGQTVRTVVLDAAPATVREALDSADACRSSVCYTASVEYQLWFDRPVTVSVIHHDGRPPGERPLEYFFSGGSDPPPQDKTGLVFGPRNPDAPVNEAIEYCIDVVREVRD